MVTTWSCAWPVSSYWGRRGGDEARKALVLLAQDLDKLPGEDRLRLEGTLADAFARLGDPAPRRASQDPGGRPETG